MTLKNLKSFRLFLFCCLTLAPLSPSHAESAAPTHGVTAYGKLTYPPHFTHFKYVNPKAPKGGVAKFATTGNFDNFNPVSLKGDLAAGASIFPHCTLCSTAEDEISENYAYLAEKIDVALDRKSVTFTLNKNARFSDGTPVRAEDVVFSFKAFKENDPMKAQYYQDVTQAKAIDPLTVKFLFSTDKNRELPVILGQLTVLSKAHYQKHDVTKSSLTPPIGCGPYKIAEFKPGQIVKYVRVPGWWGENIPSQKGRFNYDITYQYYKDMDVLFQAFKAGDYDVRQEPLVKNWMRGYDIPAVKEGKIIKKEAPNSLPMGMQMFAFNTRKPLFQDRLVRKALSTIFDFEWANKTMFFGKYGRNLSYFSNSSLASEGLPQGEELKALEAFKDKLPPEVFTEAFKMPVTNGKGNDRKIIAEADALLKKAGWVVKEGVRVNKKTNAPFTFEFLVKDPSFERLALAYQRMLSPLGIKMSIRTVTPSQYAERLSRFDYDMLLARIPQSDNPGNEQRDFFGSKSANTPRSGNISGIHDPVIDALIELVIGASDKESLTARVKALDRVLEWGYYGAPGWYQGLSFFAYWDKFGMPDIKPQDGVGLSSWWIKPSPEKE